MKKDDNTFSTNRAVNYDDLDSAAAYLEQMAREGWMLKDITGTTRFNFVKTEPRELRFAVEIFSEGSIYDTYTIESNQEYIEYCKKAGWNFICSSGKIDYFYTEDKDAPEIESDPAMKLKTIEKAQRQMKIVFPLIFIAMSAVNLLINLTNSLNVMECSFLHFSAAMLWIFVGALYIMMLIFYLAWRGKARRAVADGEKIPPNKMNLSFKAGYGLIIAFGLVHSAFMLLMGLKFGEKEVFMFPFIWAVIILLVFISRGLSVYAEKKRLSRGSYKALLVVLSVVWSAVLIAGITIVVVLIMNSSSKEQISLAEKDMEVFGESDVFVKRDQTDTHWGHFILSVDQYTLTAYDEEAAKGHNEEEYISDETGLSRSWRFNIYKPRFKSTYDRLLKEAREEKYRQLSINFDTDIATHVPEFESDGITVLSIKGKYSPIMQRYLIFDGKSIVYLRCDEDLSAQQMDVIRRSFL